MFCSGVLFFLISIFRIREYIINAIPKNLKLAISAGVGLFLGIIALEQAKIVVAHPATLVTLGDLKQWPAILCLLGFVLIVALNYRKIIGGTLIGILVVTLIGIPLGLAQFSGIVSMPPSLAPTFLQLDFSRVFEQTFIIVVFSFLLVDMFDNAGTLIGVTHRAGLLDKDGNLPRMRQALIADSFAAMFGSLIGTSTTTSYIESAAGVVGRRPHRPDRGVRRDVVPAGAVLLAARRHGAGLCVGGGAALRRLRDDARAWPRWTGTTSPNTRRRWSTAVTMPLTYSIATGIGLGFITYVLCKIIAGKFSRGQARGGGPGAIVRHQVRGHRMNGNEKIRRFVGVRRWLACSGAAMHADARAPPS